MYFEVLCFIFRFLHLRISNKQYPENSAEDIIRNVQTIAELLLEPLITTLLVMDRDILSTITVSNYFVLKVNMLTKILMSFWNSRSRDYMFRITLQGSLVSCLMGMLELMNEKNYLCLWDNLGTRNRVKNILLQTFLLFHDLVDSEVYPKEWSVMRLTATGRIMLCTMQELAKPLVLYFKDVENFDNQVKSCSEMRSHWKY